MIDYDGRTNFCDEIMTGNKPLVNMHVEWNITYAIEQHLNLMVGMTGFIQTVLLRSHYRNYGEHKGLTVLNSELLKLSL